MAERIQPLSDVGPVRHVPAQPRTPARTPSFSELVHAHHAAWRGRQDSTPDRAAEDAYDSMHAAFEATTTMNALHLYIFGKDTLVAELTLKNEESAASTVKRTPAVAVNLAA